MLEAQHFHSNQALQILQRIATLERVLSLCNTESTFLPSAAKEQESFGLKAERQHNSGCETSCFINASNYFLKQSLRFQRTFGCYSLRPVFKSSITLRKYRTCSLHRKIMLRSM